MLTKIKKGINDPRKAWHYILDYLNTFRATEIIEILDVNRDELENKEKLVICIGFNPWKRDYFKEYLPEYCLAFTRGRTPVFKIISVLKSLDKPYEMFILSYQGPKAIYKYLLKNKIKIHRVEDDFIRSIGLGSDKTKPLSLVIDNDSIYFNPKVQSKLENMVDFIKHTVEVFAKYNQRDLLLIKPHPHEERSEIAKDLTERMKDFIPNRLPKNILFLENSAFSLHDFVDKIDVGLLWNGTASMEIGARNKKVIICSHFGKFEYPINFEYPNSRKHYEDMLIGKCEITIHADIATKSKMLLHYMSTDEIAILFKYSHRRLTNNPVGGVHWIEEEINKYLKEGDKYMEICARKLLKKYPRKNQNV